MSQQSINSPTAQGFYERIRVWATRFFGLVGQDEYFLATCYDSTGNLVVVHAIGYYNPDVIVLIGEDTQKNKSFVISHVASVQLTLKIMKITQPDQQPRRNIGFIGEQLPPPS